MKFVIKQTKEFNKWFVKQSLKIRAQISDRVDRLQEFGYMGNTKALGNKNDQKKNIERAKKIKNKLTS